jgi:hypothetical protein
MRSNGGLTNKAKGYEVFGYQLSEVSAAQFNNRDIKALF